MDLVQGIIGQLYIVVGLNFFILEVAWTEQVHNYGYGTNNGGGYDYYDNTNGNPSTMRTSHKKSIYHSNHRKLSKMPSIQENIDNIRSAKYPGIRYSLLDQNKDTGATHHNHYRKIAPNNLFNKPREYVTRGRYPGGYRSYKKTKFTVPNYQGNQRSITRKPTVKESRENVLNLQHSSSYRSTGDSDTNGMKYKKCNQR